MKHYYLYALLFTVIFAGCSEEMESAPEIVDTGEIEVKFSVDGNEVETLDLSSVSHTVEVEVTLNNDNVYWTPVSDQPWCRIVDQEHKGSGKFTIKIDANNSFSARETAQISFVAGQFSIPKLNVTHGGNVFVIDNLYSVSTKGAGNAAISVSTLEGVDWTVDCDEWMTAEKAGSSAVDGMVTTQVNITWNENAGASRFGEVRFVKSGATGADGTFNVWQYGTDVTYDESGYILLGAKQASPLELRAPAQIVDNIEGPDWVSYQMNENSDNTVSYMLQFKDNPSDAKQMRAAELSLSMRAGDTDVMLPAVRQEYYDVEGLLTGAGFALFAKTWNEGGDVAQWCVNGVPTVVSDVDFSEITEWVPIGTESRPWTGVFNGNTKKLLNFNASAPLFGYCKDAKISDLTFDSSSFSIVAEYGDELYLAPLAGVISNTVVVKCTNNADVLLDASTKSTAAKVYVAGMVAKADVTSEIKNCTNTASIVVPVTCVAPAGNSDFYVGGIVAYNEGAVEYGFNNGDIQTGIQIGNVYFGGVTGYSGPQGSMFKNLNAGTLSYNAERGDNIGLNGFVGGIAGAASGDMLDNTNEGDINLASNVISLSAGGILGALQGTEPCDIKNNTNTESAVLRSTGAPRYLSMGGLVGSNDNSCDFILDFTGDTGRIRGKVASSNIESNNSDAIMALGGYVGATSHKLTIKGAKEGADIELDQSVSINSKIIGVGGVLGYVPPTSGSLTIDEVVTGNKIDVVADNTKGIGALLLSIGGVVGAVDYNGTDDIVTEIKNTTNKANVLWSNNAGRWNGRCCTAGGIVGCIKGGRATLTNCHNQAKIENKLYNDYGIGNIDIVNCAGGIIGRYNQETTGGSLTITGCTHSGEVANIRGCSGGIAALVRDAHISECTVTGQITAGGALQYFGAGTQGGVSAVAKNTVFTSCTVKSNMTIVPQGVALLRAGGVCAVLQADSVVDRCAFFGEIGCHNLGTNEAHYGGLAGLAESTTTIKDSKFGGTVFETAVTQDNYSSFIANAVVNGTANSSMIVNCSYWDGK